MKRVEFFNELLVAVFGGRTVQPSAGQIKYSGDGTASLKYTETEYRNYVKLFKIAFLDDDPIYIKTDIEGAFDRGQSISRLLTFLGSYRDISYPDEEYKDINSFAFESSVTLLKAVYSGIDDPDRMDIGSDDISKAVMKAFDNIYKSLGGFRVCDIIDEINQESKDRFFDTKYREDPGQYNYAVSIYDISAAPDQCFWISDIKLRIYVYINGRYDKHSSFFFRDMTSGLECYGAKKELSNDTGERFLTKPVSFLTIKKPGNDYTYFVTHLDEDSILKEYQCFSRECLRVELRHRFAEQYSSEYNEMKEEYEHSLISYTQDIIKRIMSLDLKWLYGNKSRNVSKCREEIKKIIVGYPEIYTYLDSCSDDVIAEQLVTILRHAVESVTSFINAYGDSIAYYGHWYNIEPHINYIKGLCNGKKYKEWKAYSETLNVNDKEKPTSLGEYYYYTSGNGLAEWLNALAEYYDCLKNKE